MVYLKYKDQISYTEDCMLLWSVSKCIYDTSEEPLAWTTTKSKTLWTESNITSIHVEELPEEKCNSPVNLVYLKSVT